jgi:hypothetical protein
MLLLGLVLAFQSEDADRQALAAAHDRAHALEKDIKQQWAAFDANDDLTEAPKLGQAVKASSLLSTRSAPCEDCDDEEGGDEDAPMATSAAAEKAARDEDTEQQKEDNEAENRENIQKLMADPTLDDAVAEEQAGLADGQKQAHQGTDLIHGVESVTKNNQEEAESLHEADTDCLQEEEAAAARGDPPVGCADAGHRTHGQSGLNPDQPDPAAAIAGGMDDESFVQLRQRVAPILEEQDQKDPAKDFAAQVKRVNAHKKQMQKLEAELQKEMKEEKAEEKSHKHSPIWGELQHPWQHKHQKATSDSDASASSLLETGDESVPRTMKKVEAEAARVEIKKILDRAKRQQEGFERMASDAEKAKTQARAAMAKLPKAQHDLEEARIHLEEERREHPRSSEIGNLRSDD